MKKYLKSIFILTISIMLFGTIANAQEVTTVTEEQNATSDEVSPIASNLTLTGLTATSYGTNKVKLTWDAVSGAEGYLVYAQKDGVYGYVGWIQNSTTTSYIDTNALSTDYNFYWVFPYYTDTNAQKIAGSCSSYKYAIGKCSSVTGLKSSATTTGNLLSWDASTNADGYLIYGIRPDEAYGYIGMTTQGTTYKDTLASTSSYTYYWCIPFEYASDNTTMVTGFVGNYTYGCGIPSTSILSSDWVVSGDSRTWYDEDGKATDLTEYKYTTNGVTIWGYYGESDGLIDLVNMQRECGGYTVDNNGNFLDVIYVSETLTSIAQSRVLELTQLYGHSGLDTDTEVIGINSPTYIDVFTAWCYSSNHAYTILNRDLTNAGAACFWYDSDDKGTLIPYWIIVFNY